MEKTSAYKWVVILFFSVVGIAFTVSIMYLAAGNIAPDTYWGRKMTMSPAGSPVSAQAPDKVVLVMDEGRRVGNRVFFYRGCRDGQLMIDVIISEIDRDYPYPFKIDLKQAGSGFRLADVRFRLVTRRGRYISLQILP